MPYTVDNAVILAAGFSSRFVPISYETPKGLLRVRGEVLIERQIRQLQEAGIRDIIVVTGYKAEQFAYLKDKFDIRLVHNAAYSVRNNHSSLYAVQDVLNNTYVCSSDNYFTENPFTPVVDDAYYAGVFSEGETQEWCMTAGEDGYIDRVFVGGCNQWYMFGHTFWNAPFSRSFVRILNEVYDAPQTADLLWEGIYMHHLDELKMRIRPYPPGVIYEFDSLEELREFDASYYDDAHSEIMRRLAKLYDCSQHEMTDFCLSEEQGRNAFSFRLRRKTYTVQADQVGIV